MRAVVSMLALVAAAALPVSLAAQPREQTAYASVLDKDGRPVGGLDVDDFVVKEDGAAREILRAGRTGDPIDLAIIVDNSSAIQPYQNDIRKALRRSSRGWQSTTRPTSRFSAWRTGRRFWWTTRRASPR